MTTLELYRKHKKGEIGRDRFLYEVRRDNNLPWITNITSYDDAVKILKNKGIIREELTAKDKFPNAAEHYKKLVSTGTNKKDAVYQALDKFNITRIHPNIEDFIDYLNNLDKNNMLKEAQFEPQNIPTDPLVDRVNPYALKREVEKLLAKEPELTNDSYKLALNKAAKKLTTPEAVKKAMFANADSVSKADAKLQMTPVKKNNLKDKANEMKKAKGQAMPKATAAPTKENKKTKKPKGVEVMKDKGVEGSEKVLRETALAELQSFLKKKLNLSEDLHHEYHVGMEVHLPGGGMGKIVEMIGSTCTVEKADGGLQDLQLSALNHAKKQAMEAAEKGATVDEAKTSDIKAGNKYHWGGKKVEIVSVEGNTIKARQVGDSQVFILRDPKNLKPIKEEKELGYEAGIKLADKLVDAIEMYNSLSDEEKEAEAKRLGVDVLAKLKAAHDDIMNRIHDESNYPAQEEDNLDEDSARTIAARKAKDAAELNYLKAKEADIKTGATSY